MMNWQQIPFGSSSPFAQVSYTVSEYELTFWQLPHSAEWRLTDPQSRVMEVNRELGQDQWKEAQAWGERRIKGNSTEPPLADIKSEADLLSVKLPFEGIGEATTPSLGALMAQQDKQSFAYLTTAVEAQRYIKFEVPEAHEGRITASLTPNKAYLVNALTGNLAYIDGDGGSTLIVWTPDCNKPCGHIGGLKWQWCDGPGEELPEGDGWEEKGMDFRHGDIDLVRHTSRWALRIPDGVNDADIHYKFIPKDSPETAKAWASKIIAVYREFEK